MNDWCDETETLLDSSFLLHSSRTSRTALKRRYTDARSCVEPDVEERDVLALFEAGPVIPELLPEDEGLFPVAFPGVVVRFGGMVDVL